jgi:tRNA U54 and U55 pseudouridine synthase Pus10
VDIKNRDACRLIRALRKIAYEMRGPREGKAKKPEKRVYRAFITLEDQVGVHHLRHRVGKKEELQTTLQHPHQFRNTLIRVYRLKNLSSISRRRLTLLEVGESWWNPDWVVQS